MRFEWDPLKAARTKAKRGISFEEAETVFLDPYALSRYDVEHSEMKDRFIRIGRIAIGIITVVYTDRSDDNRRLISVRKATRKEQRAYYDHQEKA